MTRRTSRARPVIHLIGTSGHPNYGDELITAGWLRYYARVLPEAQVWLDTPRPGSSAVLFDGLHPGLRCVDTLSRACADAPTDGPDATLDHGRRVVHEPGLAPRVAPGLENLARVDLVHVIGGGYVNALWPHHLALLGAARALGDRNGTRTALTGAGLVPLVDGSACALGATVAGFDVVDLRDAPSRAAVAEHVRHATCTGDDAFLGLDGVTSLHPQARIMLCLQSDLLEIPLDALADYVVRTLRAWGADRERVTLVECIPPDDAKVMSLLEPRLPRLSFEPFSNLWRHGFPATPDQRWITTRFHAHLVGAAAGAWGVAVPVSDDYYRVKHASLVAQGSGWVMATDLGAPVRPGMAPRRPYGGRLAAISRRKLAVARNVSALAVRGRRPRPSAAPSRSATVLGRARTPRFTAGRAPAHPS